jgi:epoxyqueuosine reductase QueG
LKAGLGILGKNGLLLNEKYGSYVFVADLVTDIHPEKLDAVSAKAYEFCRGCGACLRACPTGVLRRESQECLSAITQKKGELSEEEKALMKKRDFVKFPLQNLAFYLPKAQNH